MATELRVLSPCTDQVKVCPGIRLSASQVLPTMFFSKWLYVTISVVTLTVFAYPSVPGQSYRVAYLGELHEDGATIAHALNQCGDVVGESGGIDGVYVDAFTWNDSRGIRNLPTLPAGDYGQATGIDNGGEIAGSSNAGSTTWAVLWTNDGRVKQLGALPGDTASQAFGINNRGDVVGFSSGPQGTRGFIWNDKDGMRAISGLPGSDYTVALGVNDLGQVVGKSGTTVAAHAFLWSAEEGTVDLGTLPGDKTSKALAINAHGQVVGSSHGHHRTHAFIWAKGQGMKYLGTLPKSDFSEALAINNSGQVVGNSGDELGFRGFIWTSDSGMQDLNRLLPADADVLLVAAYAINDRGQIAGYGGPSHVHLHHFNAPRAYLLTPIGTLPAAGACPASSTTTSRFKQQNPEVKSVAASSQHLSGSREANDSAL